MAHEGFSKLKAMLSKKSNVTNPGALAAAIGRKKYSERTMEEASKKHESVPTILKKRKEERK